MCQPAIPHLTMFKQTEHPREIGSTSTLRFAQVIDSLFILIFSFPALAQVVRGVNVSMFKFMFMFRLTLFRFATSRILQDSHLRLLKLTSFMSYVLQISRQQMQSRFANIRTRKWTRMPKDMKRSCPNSIRLHLSAKRRLSRTFHIFFLPFLFRIRFVRHDSIDFGFGSFGFDLFRIRFIRIRFVRIRIIRIRLLRFNSDSTRFRFGSDSVRIRFGFDSDSIRIPFIPTGRPGV